MFIQIKKGAKILVQMRVPIPEEGMINWEMSFMDRIIYRQNIIARAVQKMLYECVKPSHLTGEEPLLVYVHLPSKANDVDISDEIYGEQYDGTD